MPKVMRHMLREYYGIPTGTDVDYEYHYINTGFTRLEENGNAQTESEAYIGDVNATTDVTGYENSWAYTTQYINDNEVCKDLVDIARLQKTGSDCVRSLISIDMSESVDGKETSFAARRQTIVVEAAPPKGEPRSITTSEGTFHQNGNQELGTFDIASKTFTPDAT